VGPGPLIAPGGRTSTGQASRDRPALVGGAGGVLTAR